MPRNGSPPSTYEPLAELFSPLSSRGHTETRVPSTEHTQESIQMTEVIQAGPHVSRKYTKEELLARHWDLNINQATRVKALLLMGVSEEDLVIADRLIKLGR